MGIRNNPYNAEVPTVTGPLRRKQSVHGFEAAIARAHTRRRVKFTLPGPMTIVDLLDAEALQEMLGRHLTSKVFRPAPPPWARSCVPGRPTMGDMYTSAPCSIWA